MLGCECAFAGAVEGWPCLWAEISELGVRVAGLMADPLGDLDLRSPSFVQH